MNPTWRYHRFTEVRARSCHDDATGLCRSTLFSGLGVLFLVISALLAPCTHIHGQDLTLVQDYWKDYAKATDDTARAIALSEVGFNLIHSAPDSARYYLTEALRLAERIGKPQVKGTARINLAWLESKLGNDIATERLARSALLDARAGGDSALVGTVLSVQASLAEQRGDITLAMLLYKASLDRWKELGEKGPEASMLYNIGRLYDGMGEYRRARELFERARVVQTELGNRNSQANCLLMIGATWKGEKEFGKAIDHYTQAALIFEELDNHRGMALAAENMGLAFKTLDGQRALVHFRESLKHFVIHGNTSEQAVVHRHIADVLSAAGRLEEAGLALQNGYTLVAGSDPKEEQLYALALAELAVKQGRSDVALGHYERHMALKDSLNGIDAQRELMRLRAEFETEQAEQENDLLKAENALSRANEAKMKARWTAAAAISLGLILLLGLLYRNYRQRGRHTQEVERFNTELQAQRDQVQRMNDLLELKILRTQLNPHFIYNCQNSAIAMVKEGRSIDALAYLQGLSKLMRMVLEHSVNDRITVEEEMDFLRLYLKLESLRLEGLTYAVDADPELLDEEAELPALLVQPFVENALWHGLAAKAGPRELAVRFNLTDQGMRCTVRDNGIGRNAQGAKTDGHRSLGTELTNDRLQLLTHRLQQKGSFTIRDRKDPHGNPEGTEVIIDLEG